MSDLYELMEAANLRTNWELDHVRADGLDQATWVKPEEIDEALIDHAECEALMYFRMGDEYEAAHAYGYVQGLRQVKDGELVRDFETGELQ